MTKATLKYDFKSVLRLSELADYIVPFSIRLAADLRLADHMASGPRSVDTLAAAAGVDGRSLHRMLRALACKGVFAEVEPGVFELTPMAQLLRTDHPLSLQGAFPLLSADIEAWAHLDYSIRTGKPAFAHVKGQDYWDYLSKHPDYGKRFDRAMQAFTKLELLALVRAYDWGSLGTVVDIGGGNGAFLAGLLKHFPKLQGVVFDQPRVAEAAQQVLAKEGVAERCSIATGSYLEAVPAGHDTYMMKRVLWARDDAEAVALLRVVREAMREDSRLLVLEGVMRPGNDFEPAKLHDLIQLVLGGSYARTQPEIEALFAQAGLRLTTVFASPVLPIVEAVPTALKDPLGSRRPKSDACV